MAATQLMTRSDLSRSLMISLCCFALSIPILAGCYLNPPDMHPAADNWSNLLRFVLYMVASGVSVVGLLFFFCHFHGAVGALFAVGVCGGWWTAFRSRSSF